MLMGPQTIKKTLQNQQMAVLKKLAQHFLISPLVLEKIIQSACLTPEDTVLEIGPGLGSLTFALAQRVKRVVGVEKDKKMATMLIKALAENNIANVKVVNGDILNLSLGNLNLHKTKYKLIANLPYNIAAPLILKFLKSKNPPLLMVVMVQKEMAQRIVAQAPKMNKLAVLCQIYATAQIIAFVAPSAFWPKPKVSSAVLLLRPQKNSFFAQHPKMLNVLEKIVHSAFGQPRKTILNNLVHNLDKNTFDNKEAIKQWLVKNHINPNQRPQTLFIHNWLSLVKNYKNFYNN